MTGGALVGAHHGVQAAGAVGPAGKFLALLMGFAVLAALMLASLCLGARSIPLSAVLEALLSHDPGVTEHIIVVDYRWPRTLLGLSCGIAFGVSGALIQAATRNPLADPGILGVNAGAVFAMTLAVALFGVQSIHAFIWFALAGAILVTIAVYALAMVGRDGATPVRMVLVGVAFSAVLGGFSSAVTLVNPDVFNFMRFWSVGSLGGRNMETVIAVAPFIGAGLLVAITVLRPLNAMALGEDLAKALGADVLKARIAVVVAVTLLAGAGTAAVGPVSFVGLIVPHVVRWYAGPDQRWIIPLTMVFAPVLLLGADIAGRLILFPAELEAGILTAFVGAPVLILLARRKQASGL